MVQFEILTEYDEALVKQLVRVQYNSFCVLQKLSILLIASTLILVAVYAQLDDTFTAALLMLGCWCAASTQFPATRAARRIIRSAAGQFSSPKYCFKEREINITEEGKVRSIQYTQIARILEDRLYFYVFLNKNAGFLLSKAAIIPSDYTRFRAFLELKANIGAEKANSSLIYNMRKAYERRQNATHTS